MRTELFDSGAIVRTATSKHDHDGIVDYSKSAHERRQDPKEFLFGKIEDHYHHNASFFLLMPAPGALITL